MNNRQSSPYQNSSDLFFTAGQGDPDTSKNTFEAENNLDLSGQTSWEQGNRDYRNIGNRAIFSHETPADTQTAEKYNESQINATNRLGEIVDLAPPSFTTNILEKDNKFNPGSIRTDGERLSKTTLAEIKQSIERLNQTGDVADFYATIRGDVGFPGMMRENLKNSYGREVA